LFQDEGVHAAYFTIKEDMLRGSKLAAWHNDTGGRVVMLRPDPHPEGRTRGHFMCVTTRDDVETKAKLNQALKEGNESYMKLLEERYADAGWVAKPVLKAMRESDDFYCSIFAQIRSPRLQNDGAVVLLGDAGYATPGFGTSLAIMGGYILVGELLNSGFEVSTALKRYEGLVQPFVKKSQGDDNMMQYLNPQTWWGVWIRDTILWLVAGLKLDKLMIMVSAMLGMQDSQLAMPDYPWPKEE